MKIERNKEADEGCRGRKHRDRERERHRTERKRGERRENERNRTWDPVHKPFLSNHSTKRTAGTLS